MSIWALGDLHLSFGVPNKKMDLFGPQWKNHPQRIETNWKERITADDLVLLPGDISWAMHPEEVKKDLAWIDSLPGTKVMIRGNHDYWWSSLRKVEEILPPSIHLIQNNVYIWRDVAIGGARLWDTPEYGFGEYITFRENPKENKEIKVEDPNEIEKIFHRELGRLENSLKQMPEGSLLRIAMTHYPPIGANLAPSRASSILEKYGISTCVFGHLHNVKHGQLPFGKKNGVKYLLTACDYVDFIPIKIGENR